MRALLIAEAVGEEGDAAASQLKLLHALKSITKIAVVELIQK
jgi:hypothetical protein